MRHVRYSHIWKIALPILISLVTEHLVLLTDTAFLGRVGEIELGAASLAGIYFLAVLMLGYGFSMGAQILIGRRNGEERFTQIGHIVIQGSAFLLLLALVLYGFTRVFSPMILHGILSSEAIYQAAMAYLDWRVYGFFFAFIALMFRAYYVGIGKTGILTVASATMVAVNVVLNYVLIFGKFGFPQMGIGGAALASSLSEGVSVLFYVLYTWRTVDRNKYGFTGPFRPEPALVRQILAVSSWTMLQYLLGVSVWFIFFVAVEHLGERAIAVSNIVRSYGTLLFMISSALGSACVSIASNLMGAGRADEVLGAMGKTVALCSMIMVPVAVLTWFFPELFIRIYTDNPELAAASVPPLRVFVVSLAISVPSSIMFQTVSGTGNTRAALVLDLVGYVLYVAFVYVVIFRWRADVAVAWFSEYVYWGSILLVTVIYLKKANWKARKI